MWFRRKSPTPEQITNADVMKLVIKLQERCDDIELAHKRLRGKVYARWGKDPEQGDHPVEVPPEQLSREELKRRLTSTGRFVPGRPAQHSE